MIGGGRPLLPEILDQTDRVGTKKSVMNSLILIGIKKPTGTQSIQHLHVSKQATKIREIRLHYLGYKHKTQ